MSEELLIGRRHTEEQLKYIAKFMNTVKPENPVNNFETRVLITTATHSVPVKRRVLESLPTTSASVYESTSRKPKFEIEIYDYDEGRRRMTVP